MHTGMRTLSLSVCTHAHYTIHMHTRYIALRVYAHTHTVAALTQCVSVHTLSHT